MSKREIEPPSIGQADKVYRVVIIDETDGKEEIFNETMTGLCLVGEKDERMCEIVMNENLLSMAAMLRAGSKTKHAVRLATFLENMRRDETAENATEFEDMLNGMLEGGLQ